MDGVFEFVLVDACECHDGFEVVFCQFLFGGEELFECVFGLGSLWFEGREFFVFVVEVHPLFEDEFQFFLVVEHGSLFYEVLFNSFAAIGVELEQLGFRGAAIVVEYSLCGVVGVVDGVGAVVFCDDSEHHEYYVFDEFYDFWAMFCELFVEEAEKLQYFMWLFEVCEEELVGDEVHEYGQAGDVVCE